jgi:biotin carboxyl carrier protein
MDLIVRNGPREERVGVRRVDGGFEVTLGGRTYHVDAGAAHAGLHSLRIDGAQHEVAVHREDEGVYWVSAGQVSGTVEVVDPLTHLAAQTRGGKGGKRRRRVTAYMPGRVVALLAEEGQPVTAGQGVVVLEAMKMENEIGAEHDGTIGTIFVQPGQAVEMGNPLFELEE